MTTDLCLSATEGDANERKRARMASKRKRPRSSITSGRTLFIDGDPNSAWSRRFHDLILGHIADISAGRGANALSDAQLCLVRRAAAIECEPQSTGIDAPASRARTAPRIRRVGIATGAKPCRQSTQVQNGTQIIAGVRQTLLCEHRQTQLKIFWLK